MPKKKKNHVTWFEIFVKDFEKAKAFYGELFGWDFKPLRNYPKEYWTIYTGSNSPGGGLMKKEGDNYSNQSTIIYVEVDDIEETLKQVILLGGSVQQPNTLITETSGHFGLFKDHDGNTVGLWSV